MPGKNYVIVFGKYGWLSREEVERKMLQLDQSFHNMEMSVEVVLFVCV